LGQKASGILEKPPRAVHKGEKIIGGGQEEGDILVGKKHIPAGEGIPIKGQGEYEGTDKGGCFLKIRYACFLDQRKRG
jgi:hypothetical protein